MQENTIKNILFYLQRHSRCSILHKQLEEYYNYLLNNSWVERRTVSTTEAHISFPGPHTHTPARSGDRTRTPRPRASGINSLRHQYSSPRLHSPAVPETLPTAENRLMDQDGRPPDIKHFLPITRSLFSLVVTIPFYSTYPRGIYMYK